jgi:hypothetical protein
VIGGVREALGVRARREDVDCTRRDDDLRGSVEEPGWRGANAMAVVMGQCADGPIGEGRDGLELCCPLF